MMFLLFLFGATLVAGSFFILADALKLPKLATERALISAGRSDKKLVKSTEALLLGWAVKLVRFVHLDEYKRRRLEQKLTATGLDMRPEVYTVYGLLKPCLILLAIIPCLMILPILSPVVLILALLVYFKESRRADELVRNRIDKIEGELPRFVATIEQELSASRDVLRILENYKKHADEDFARELDILTADMRSSSYEAALIRFEARMGSATVSDITRGLIAVLRGDDGRQSSPPSTTTMTMCTMRCGRATPQAGRPMTAAAGIRAWTRAAFTPSSPASLDSPARAKAM